MTNDEKSGEVEFLSPDDYDFIVDALNERWHKCSIELERRDLGDIERMQNEKVRDRSKKLLAMVEAYSDSLRTSVVVDQAEQRIIPLVFESKGTKPGWFYCYKDEQECNQHSELYATEQEAKDAYYARFGVKLNPDNIISTLNRVLDEMEKKVEDREEPDSEYESGIDSGEKRAIRKFRKTIANLTENPNSK